jgi:hypothetical protein
MYFVMMSCVYITVSLCDMVGLVNVCIIALCLDILCYVTLCQ